MTSCLGRSVRIITTTVVAGMLATGPLAAQESGSAALAKELTTRLEEAKLQSVAARVAGADQFVGALWIQGFQLLVVSAKYSAPAIMAEKLAKKQYRDIYLDLNAAAVPGSRLFIEDLSADGLRARAGRNDPFDTYESGSSRVTFDGDYRAQKISEDEYNAAFAAAETAYQGILNALLAELKKGS